VLDATYAVRRYRSRVTGRAERWHWLGRWWFFASVAVLVVNDHVLKERFGGWWTGKLSDIAGLLVVALLLSVPMGSEGLVVAGAGFVALKTVPGVAEVAAPLLGGVTRRDATDLIAIGVLVPAGVLMHRSGRPAVDHRSARRTRPIGHAGPAPAARGLAVLPVLGAVVAVFATTATACGPRPAVDRLVVVDGVVYAEVVFGAGPSQWASTDDGTTWTKAPQPPGGVRSFRGDPYEAKAAGPLRACGSDGTCFRLRDQRVIEVTSPDGNTVEELRLSEEQLDKISTGCAGAQRGVLTSLAPPTVPGRPAMASLGAHGVVVRQDDGHWARVDVLGAHPPAPQPPAGLLLGLLVFGPPLALGIWAFARDRWPSWRAAVGVALGGWLATLSVAGTVGFFSGEDGNAGWWVAVLGCCVVPVAAIMVARSTRFAPRRPPPPSWEMLPPPPDPPGGFVP